MELNSSVEVDEDPTDQSNNVRPPNPKLSPVELEEACRVLKHSSQFYKEENMKMEAIFKKLKLIDDDNKFRDLDFLVSEDILGSAENSTDLASALKSFEQDQYLKKIKMSMRHCIEVNESLAKETEFLEQELENAGDFVEQLLPSNPQTLKGLQEKYKQYERQVKVFKVKYPMLTDPKYNLSNLSTQMETLKSLQEERDKLQKKLSVYKNLKPDLKEAKRQLASLKEELRTMSGLENN